MTYSDTIQMSPSELREHPEVELCACAHPRGLHATSRDTLTHCNGAYFPSLPCGCGGFTGTDLRLKNSLISLDDHERSQKLVEEFRTPASPI